MVLLGILSEKLGVNEVELDLRPNATLGDLLRSLVGSLGWRAKKLLLDEKGAPKRYLNILIDGIEAEALGGLKAAIPEGARVALIPIAGGG